MRQATSTSAAATAAAELLLRLRSILTRPIRLERRGIDWHFVFAPQAQPQARIADARRTSEPPPHHRSAMPSMTNIQVAELCTNLRAVLGGDIGRHPRLPSLALLERALYKDGVRGIDEVPACVLRHAAQSLDAIDLDQYGPGLVVLRRRIEQVLRRRHGDGRSRASIPQPILRAAAPDLAADGSRDFSDSLTEFIDIDKMFVELGP
jgi:hypothetical protein